MYVAGPVELSPEASRQIAEVTLWFMGLAIAATLLLVWAMGRLLRFAARNTAYRKSFSGKVAYAYGFVTVLALGLLVVSYMYVF